MASIRDPISLDKIQQEIWSATIPLEIRLSPSESRLYDKTDPYLVSTPSLILPARSTDPSDNRQFSIPRLTYLPTLFSRLQTFYSDSLIVDLTSAEPTGYFTHDGIPLKPHLPVGLLYDIHVLSTSDVDPKHKIKATPFTLTVHFSSPAITNTNNQSSDAVSTLQVLPQTSLSLHDAFINSTKEADFLRSGTAKPIMALSAVESQALWTATVANDLSTYAKIFASLLPGSGTSNTQMPWRNIPLRIYLPATAETSTLDTADDSKPNEEDESEKPSRTTPRSQVRVLQSQIPPFASTASSSFASTQTSHLRGQTSNTPQTLGMALHTLLPALFPSRRTPILAKPLLHGAVVPMNASLEELASKACYADGWVNIVVAVTG